MNSYISNLVEALSNRYSVETEGMTTGQWLMANTTHRGMPFSFKGYEFQRAIVDDLHPDMDVLKISQVGLSEIQMRKAFALCVRNPGLVGIFSLPNEVMYRRFYQTRMKPVVEGDKVFNSDADRDSVRSMAVMQFGRSFLNIVNATEGAATSISADFVFNDEVDLSDSKMIALFASRLQNSSMKIKQRFSTPTWTGYGIDGTYSVSDQREYQCRCEACRKWQTPMWDENSVIIPGLPSSLKLNDITADIVPKLNLEESLIVCTGCGSPLDLDSSRREWVATFPSRKHARGYRVRPFSSGRISVPYIVTQLIAYQRQNYLRGWHNTVIGEPYTASDARLEEAQIRRCIGSPNIPDIDPSTPVYMGIDMGQIAHLTLAHPSPDGFRVFLFRTVRISELSSVVETYRKQYNIIGGGCDRFPYTPNADALRAQSQNKIMPFEYRGDPELKPVKDVLGTITHFQCNRTKILDTVVEMVRSKQLRFEGFGLQQEVILEHLRDMVREENPEKAATWVKLTGSDHYFHSLAFLIAGTKFQEVLDGLQDIDTRSTIVFGGVSIGRSPTLFG